MKKIFLILFMVLALNGVALATDINTNTFIPTNTNINTPVDTNVNTNTNLNTFVPTNLNSNIQGQQQGQGQVQGQMQDQGQFQGQNNKQVIAPKQTVLFESPTPLLNFPSQLVPELNFGNGRMIDATKSLPKFAIYGIKPLDIDKEMISAVLNVNANVKFKKLYQAVLDDAKAVANGGKKTLTDVRYQIIRAEAQKTWTTGGNFGGAGSGLASSGLSGGSGAAESVKSHLKNIRPIKRIVRNAVSISITPAAGFMARSSMRRKG